LKITQNAEFEVAQLRGMKKEWILKDRDAILSNTFTLLTKDSCEVKIYGNGTMETLVKKSSEIIKQSTVTSKFAKKNSPKGQVVQFYNLHYNIPKGKEELKLIRFDGYAITKYGKKIDTTCNKGFASDGLKCNWLKALLPFANNLLTLEISYLDK